MEIVIKLPEEIYDFVQNTSFVEDENTLFKQSNADRQKTLFLFDIIDAIRSGTPLPEHHGRLGDLDALEKEIINGIKAGNYEDGYEEYAHINDMDDCVECIKYTPTIIEAEEAQDD